MPPSLPGSTRRPGNGLCCRESDSLGHFQPYGKPLHDSDRDEHDLHDIQSAIFKFTDLDVVASDWQALANLGVSS